MERRKKAGLPNLEVLDFGANFWDETCRGSILFGNPFWIQWHYWFFILGFSPKRKEKFLETSIVLFFCLSPKGNLVAKAPHLFLYLSLFLGLSLYLMHIHTHAHTLTRSHAHTLTRSLARTHSLALNPHCPSRIELQFVEKNGGKCLKYFSFGIRRMNGRQKGIGLIGPVLWSIL